MSSREGRGEGNPKLRGETNSVGETILVFPPASPFFPLCPVLILASVLSCSFGKTADQFFKFLFSKFLTLIGFQIIIKITTDFQTDFQSGRFKPK
jgi:hypothetical protein